MSRAIIEQLNHHDDLGISTLQFNTQVLVYDHESHLIEILEGFEDEYVATIRLALAWLDLNRMELVV